MAVESRRKRPGRSSWRVATPMPARSPDCWSTRRSLRRGDGRSRIEPHVVNVAAWPAAGRSGPATSTRARAAAELARRRAGTWRYVDAQPDGRAGPGWPPSPATDQPAVAGYRTAIATFRALETPVDLGIALMDFATLLGPDEAGTREAADEARAIFDGLGANGLIERLDIGLAGLARRGSRPLRRGLSCRARRRGAAHRNANPGGLRPRASSSCRRTSGR